MPITSTVRDAVSERFLEEYILTNRWLSGDRVVAVGNATASFSEGIESRAVLARVEDEREFIEALLSSVQPEDTVYDIGSQYGLFTCLAGDIATDGFVVAVEPTRGPYYRTSLNMEANDVAGVAVRAALTNQAIELPEWLDAAEINSDLLYAGDNLREYRGLPQPNIIKMDIEGAEKIASEGLEQTISDRECRSVFLEVHPKGCFSMGGYEEVGLSGEEVTELKSFLSNCGFSLSEIQSRGDQVFLKAEQS